MIFNNFCVAGGRDREGRTIVTIPALHKGSERPKEELANTLYYLVNTVSEEVRENGFCIVVDSRGYSWQTVKQTLRMLQVRVCVVCMCVCVVCVYMCVLCMCVCVCCVCTCACVHALKL